MRLSAFLKRYHQVFVSAPTILRVFLEHRVPRASLKRHRSRSRRLENLLPDQSVEGDVKFLKGWSGRFDQFTEIDEAPQ